MYIVTGGAGFIGSAFVWKLNQMGVDDIVVVDNLGNGDKWRNLSGLRFAEYVHKTQFLELLADDGLPDDVAGVVHLGACSSTTETDAEYLMDNNYRYTQTVVRWALEKGVRLVNAGSAATYGDGSRGFSDDESSLEGLRPLNMYGYTKHLIDLWARREGLQDHFATLKFFNVFGPNEYHKDDMRSVVCKAHAQILETGRLRLFRSCRPEYPDGGQMRDFVYVKDVLEVLWWLLEHPGVNGVFNVGTGRARTWNDLAAAVFAAMGREPAIDYVDMPEALRDRYQYFTQAPMDKLRATGCPVPATSLEDAVRDYVAGYLAAPSPYLGV